MAKSNLLPRLKITCFWANRRLAGGMIRPQIYSGDGHGCFMEKYALAAGVMVARSSTGMSQYSTSVILRLDIDRPKGNLHEHPHMGRSRRRQVLGARPN